MDDDETQIIDIGSKVSDFVVIKELGRGSYGIVNKIKSTKNGGIYVSKNLDLKLMKERNQKEAWKEALILKKLHHKNIIRYYTSFLEDGCLYIIMEYAPGGDLYSKIKKLREGRQFLSEQEIIKYSIDILSGLKYLHENNIIHRDIKCLNLFIGKDGLIKIGDMGVSKIVSNLNALHCSKVGTPLYLAPELIKQIPYDYKVDIWSAGCSIYHISTLDPPFFGDNVIILGQNIIKGKIDIGKLSNYSSLIKNIICKMLSLKPSERPTADEIIKLIPIKIYEQFNNPSLPLEKKAGKSCKELIKNNINIEKLPLNNMLTINYKSNENKIEIMGEKEIFHENKIENLKLENLEKELLPKEIKKTLKVVKHDENQNNNKVERKKEYIRPSTAILKGGISIPFFNSNYNNKNFLNKNKENKDINIKGVYNKLRPNTANFKQNIFNFHENKLKNDNEKQNQIINININFYNMEKYLSGINKRLFNKGFQNDNLLFYNNNLRCKMEENKNELKMKDNLLKNRPISTVNNQLKNIKNKNYKSFIEIIKEFDNTKTERNEKKITINDFK